MPIFVVLEMLQSLDIIVFLAISYLCNVESLKLEQNKERKKENVLKKLIGNYWSTFNNQQFTWHDMFRR